ncbi:MAG: hypothetical protein QOE52_5578 [Mycobacterium sp.]|jgi:hypothetical protein|nr:hypothetical protein [Mycobacterium sp.]
MRAEFLSNRPAFANLRAAQHAPDEWVDYYNTARPHQSLDMSTPAQRFTAAAGAPVPSKKDPAAGPERTGNDWVSRRVGANGIVCVRLTVIGYGRVWVFWRSRS